MSIQQAILLLTPPLLLVTTYLAYRFLSRRFGQKPGYFLGFLFYWIACCLFLPLLLLGPARLTDLFRPGASPLGTPAWLGLLFLATPLLLGYGYAFPRAARGATWRIIVLSAAIAIVNGVLEEVLWRGAYVAFFPDNWLLGVGYPALGFGVWHLAPQSIFPNKAPGGNVSLVAVATLTGLLWGRVAMQSGSILCVSISHVLFDFSGLGARLYLGNRQRPQ